MSTLLVSACVVVAIAACCALGCIAFVARDVAIRAFADRREARESIRVDSAAMRALERRMTDLEDNAERWNTAAREISALSGRRKA